MKRQHILLGLLAGFFLAPGIAAYFLYAHPQWIESRTNKGELLQQPIQITWPATSKKWHLVLWNPGQCKESCLANLDKLAKIRMSLGRHWYEIDQWLVSAHANHSFPKPMETVLKQQSIQSLRLSSNQQKKNVFLKESPKIFLVDPENYWVMRYAIDAKSVDIFNDLKKILVKNQ